MLLCDIEIVLISIGAGAIGMRQRNLSRDLKSLPNHFEVCSQILESADEIHQQFAARTDKQRRLVVQPLHRGILNELAEMTSSERRGDADGWRFAG